MFTYCTLTNCICMNFTEQLLPRAAGYLLDLHAGHWERVCGGDEGSRRHHGGGWRRQHLVDQRGLEGSLDAAADQVTQRDLENVLAGWFAWEEEEAGGKKESRERIWQGTRSAGDVRENVPEESVDIEKERGNVWQLMKNAWHSWPHARSVEATEMQMYLGI